jgi:hypothetical protein
MQIKKDRQIDGPCFAQEKSIKSVEYGHNESHGWHTIRYHVLYFHLRNKS